jgi:hypothetical protein
VNLPGERDPGAEPPVPDGLGPDVPSRSSDGMPARPVRQDPVRPVRPPGGPGEKRTSDQIRADMDARRRELSQSVDTLREKVVEVTDWRGQLRKHRKQILIGAVATGFVVGGLMALRRR